MLSPVRRGQRALRSIQLVFIAAASLLLLTASNADAANLGSLSSDKKTFTFTANSNAVNTVKVSYAAFALVVEDTATGGTVTAGSGCAQVTSKKISCATQSILEIDMDMGDLVDKLTMGATALIPPHVTTTVRNVGAVTSSDGPMVIYSTDPGPGNIMGGPGYDNIYSTETTRSIDAGAKDDQITIKNTITTPANQEASYWVIGGPGADMIDASESTASFWYYASEGTDVVLGSQSADEFQFGHDRDLVFGNGGDDRFYSLYAGDQSEADRSEIWGGAGNDVFADMRPQELEVTHFEGGPGVDRVTYATCNSCDPESEWQPDVGITFDDSADDGVVDFEGSPLEGDHFHLSVENIGNYGELPDNNQMGGNDRLFGSVKDNEIFGHYGTDSISGGDGDDRLSGGSESDTVSGDAGNDVIIADGDGDTLDGGTGIDTLSVPIGNSGVAIDLTGASGDDAVSLIENVIGSGNADQITGNDEPNDLDGRAGDDTFATVGGGIDTITCGDGVDTATVDANDVIVDVANCETVDVQ